MNLVTSFGGCLFLAIVVAYLLSGCSHSTESQDSAVDGFTESQDSAPRDAGTESQDSPLSLDAWAPTCEGACEYSAGAYYWREPYVTTAHTCGLSFNPIRCGDACDPATGCPDAGH